MCCIFCLTTRKFDKSLKKARPVRVFLFPPLKSDSHAMDEPSYWWQTAISVVLGLAIWIGNRAVKRVDDHHAEIEKLKRDSITKADLKEQSQTLLDAIDRGNKDVITRIGAVDAKAERANTRLDVLKDEELAKLRALAERGHPA